MDQENQKAVEKYYIEVNSSGFKKFIQGFLGGLGWGIGLTLGTSVLVILIGFLLSKINLVPILGQFFANIIKTSQSYLAK